MGYDDVIRRRVTLGGERITVATKAGMIPWDEVEVASMLLAEESMVQPGTRLLLLEGGSGALAVWAAQRGAAELHCYDGSYVAWRMMGETLDANEGVAGVITHQAAWPQADPDGAFDRALLLIPKGRAYTRLLLEVAHRALKPGGRLYLAGPNARGAKAVLKDAGAIFARAATIRTKARHRVGLAVKSADMPDDRRDAQWNAPAKELEILGLRLFSLPGVFSAGGLDGGTAMLLDTLDESLCGGAHVLDVGCGYGVIGLVAARLGAAAADLIDSHWLALDCAERSAAANFTDARSIRVWASDLYSDVQAASYDLILSNPPFHAGHQVDTSATAALIAGARARLRPGGRLRLVANRFLPYDGLLRQSFSRVEVAREDARYWVLEGRR